MRPDPAVRPEYLAAFATIAGRIEASLRGVPRERLPVRMYVSGGAALHLYTAARTSLDIDAAFSHRVRLPGGLEASYEDAGGGARLLHFDCQHNDTFALLHPDAYGDSRRLELSGVDRRVLDVRVLSPLDLAVSKIGRFSGQDREDIRALADQGLLDGEALRRRAEEAAAFFVGETRTLATSITLACRLVADAGRLGPDETPPGPVPQ